MDFETFTLGPDDDGRRLDRILKNFLPQSSLSGMYKALRNGLIKVDDKKQKGDFHVQQGQVIKIAHFLLEEKQNSFDSSITKTDKKPLNTSLIILRTKDLLFINKPYDLCVQKAQKDSDSLDQLVQEDFDYNNPDHHSLSFKTGPLHRLDRKTTGLIVFSQSLKGATEFSKIIKEHLAVKSYLALAEGTIKKQEKWSDSISKNNENSMNFHTVSVNSLTQNGKIAITTAIPLAWGKYNSTPVTLVNFIIETGRTHQIRSQSASHGYPLLGDSAYGSKIRLKKQDFFLHSWSLEFNSQNNLSLPQKIICPITKDFKQMLTLCGIKSEI